jgi:hypothetical protein
LTVPPTSGNSFTISATVTCPVQAGNTILLISQILSEYYITSWSIDPNSRQEQFYCSHPSGAFNRDYYLISVSQAQLAEINGSKLPNGGATTLANAPVVSKRLPNKSGASGGTC